jgi:hypothetical protein
VCDLVPCPALLEGCEHTRLELRMKLQRLLFHPSVRVEELEEPAPSHPPRHPLLRALVDELERRARVDDRAAAWSASSWGTPLDGRAPSFPPQLEGRLDGRSRQAQRLDHSFVESHDLDATSPAHPGERGVEGTAYDRHHANEPVTWIGTREHVDARHALTDHANVELTLRLDDLDVRATDCVLE